METPFILTSVTLDSFKKILSEIVTELHSRPATTDQIKDKEDLISRKETTKLLQVSFATLNEWTRKGQIPFYRMNRRVYFKKSEVLNSLMKVGK